MHKILGVLPRTERSLKRNILIIEDNIETAKNISLFLEHSGLQCHLAHSGQQGLSSFSTLKIDLIILDIMLPDGDGYHVCKTIRETSDVPIIMLTAKVSESSLVKGLNSGADDYVKKPYSNKELVARVQAHLRRSGNSELLELGPYSLDLVKRVVLVNDVLLQLTKSEFELARILLQQPGRVFSREQLFDQVNDETSDSFDRTLDVHMHNLRKKVTQAGLKEHKIKSVYGIGYKLDI